MEISADKQSNGIHLSQSQDEISQPSLPDAVSENELKEPTESGSVPLETSIAPTTLRKRGRRAD